MDNTLDTDLIEESEFDIPQRKPQKLIRETRVTNEKIEKKPYELTDADRRQKTLVDVYKGERKVPVRIAPSYAKYFGRVMRVAINGIIIAVKCDGVTVELPESFAGEVLRRMTEMDRYEMRLNKMAAVQNNIEMSPGQINFFG